MKKVLMSVLVIAMMANCMSGCKQQRQEVKEVQQEEDTDNPIYHAKWSSDTTAINDSETLTWRDIPADEVAKPINYEKWVALLSYIIRSGWKKPSAKMVADAGLNVLYERDEPDETGISDIHFMYGRETKCKTDSAGNRYHDFDGNHAVLFNVYAYNSSGADINFHNAADYRDFMEQAIKHGLLEAPVGLVVSDKPMKPGIHRPKKLYDSLGKEKGTYKKLFILNPNNYYPNDDWQTCDVTIDFLFPSFDIE